MQNCANSMICKNMLCTHKLLVLNNGDSRYLCFQLDRNNNSPYALSSYCRCVRISNTKLSFLLINISVVEHLAPTRKIGPVFWISSRFHYCSLSLEFLKVYGDPAWINTDDDVDNDFCRLFLGVAEIGCVLDHYELQQAYEAIDTDNSGSQLNKNENPNWYHKPSQKCSLNFQLTTGNELSYYNIYRIYWSHKLNTEFWPGFELVTDFGGLRHSTSFLIFSVWTFLIYFFLIVSLSYAVLK